MRSQREPGWMMMVLESGSMVTSPSWAYAEVLVSWRLGLGEREEKRTTGSLTTGGRTKPGGAAVRTLTRSLSPAASLPASTRFASSSCSTSSLPIILRRLVSRSLSHSSSDVRRPGLHQLCASFLTKLAATFLPLFGSS